MDSKSTVEAADRLSRTRARLVALAAVAFVAVQLITRPFTGGVETPRTAVSWAVNAGLLLMMLAVGGGWLNRRAVRALVNDEVYWEHCRRAVNVGYWVAMATAMAVYVWAGYRPMTAREAVYLVVTPSVPVALLTLAYLEHRAHRDG